MAPKLNSNPAKRNGSSGKPAATGASNPYAPSVPISVYRELAAELQATKAMLESLNAQNQSLARQNAFLKKEVQTIVQSAFQLQNLITATSQPQTISQAIAPVAQHPEILHPAPAAPSSAPKPVVPAQSTPPEAASKPSPAPKPQTPPTAAANTLKLTDLPPITDTELLFTEQPEESRPSKEETPRQLGGLWLVLVVLAIMVSAFTAGFLVMRPILLKNNPSS
jgi:hypothetical protein